MKNHAHEAKRGESEAKQTQLSDEERARLGVLLSWLDNLTTPELIAESTRLRIPVEDGEITESAKKRMRAALDGTFAAQKVPPHIEMLREVDAARCEKNRQINELAAQSETLRHSEPLAADRTDVDATQAAGVVEILLHFFAICATRIDTYVRIAAQAVGYKIPVADSEILWSFWPLRHHYEHWEQRLPGKSRHHLGSVETTSDTQWGVKMALETDDQGRFIFEGRTVDPTTRGRQELEEVVERAWSGIRAAALEAVREHFCAHPFDIPHPNDENQGFRVSMQRNPPLADIS